MPRLWPALLVSLPALATADPPRSAPPPVGPTQLAIPAACRAADAASPGFFDDHRDVQSAALATRDWGRNGGGSAVQGRIRMRGAEGLTGLTLAAFRAPQAVAFVRLDRDAKLGANASLAAGTYCLVAQYLGDGDDPEDTKESTRRNPDHWRLYLYDAAGSSDAPVGRMQFVYRVEHPNAASPPTRFLSPSADEIAAAIPEGVSRSYYVGRSAQRSLSDASAQGLFTAWFVCGDGCCTGAFDGFELMR